MPQQHQQQWGQTSQYGGLTVGQQVLPPASQAALYGGDSTPSGAGPMATPGVVQNGNLPSFSLTPTGAGAGGAGGAGFFPSNFPGEQLQ